MRLRKALESIWGADPAAVLEEKASRTGPLLAIQGTAQPVWSPRDYAALAREGFAKNPVVHRAVRLLSETAAAVPLLLFEGDKELSEHALLALLARPNAHETGADFLEALYGYLLVSGNAYLEQVPVNGVPRQLYALRPDRVKVVPGSHGWPEAFDYTAAGRTVRLPAEADDGEEAAPVRHLKLFHPLNDHYGFAPVEAAQMALDIHNAAASWNKALLDNAARPSGALIYGAGDALMVHSLALSVFSRKLSRDEAAQAAGRAAEVLMTGPVPLTGHRLVNLTITNVLSRKLRDGRGYRASSSLRAVTEPLT